VGTNDGAKLGNDVGCSDGSAVGVDDGSLQSVLQVDPAGEYPELGQTRQSL
jgi:hypothetical protein